MLVTTTTDDEGRLTVEVESPGSSDLLFRVTITDRGFLARRDALCGLTRGDLTLTAARTLMRLSGVAWRSFQQASAEPPSPTPKQVTVPSVAPSYGPSPFSSFPFEESGPPPFSSFPFEESA